MAKTTFTPPGVTIGALQEREERPFNPMAAGSGTPWEDRGSLGMATALFRTCSMALRRPGELFLAIRRPENTGEARSFAAACGCFWVIAMAMYGLLNYIRCVRLEDALKSNLKVDRPTVDGQMFFILSAVTALAMIPAIFIFHSIASRLTQNMMVNAMRMKAPASLMTNLMAYALGASLLALVPLVGPPLALIWILALMIRGPVVRLRVKVREALIPACIAFVTCLLIALVVWFAGWTLLPNAVEWQKAAL